MSDVPFTTTIKCYPRRGVEVEHEVTLAILHPGPGRNRHTKRMAAAIRVKEMRKAAKKEKKNVV